MAKIKVEVTALRENEKSLEQYIASLEELNSRLETLLGRIESSWEGDSSAAYINVMRRYAAQAANMARVLTEFKSYVRSAADTFENTDKKAASRIENAF